jgi:hypothetical protein
VGKGKLSNVPREDLVKWLQRARDDRGEEKRRGEKRREEEKDSDGGEADVSCTRDVRCVSPES